AIDDGWSGCTVQGSLWRFSATPYPSHGGGFCREREALHDRREPGARNKIGHAFGRACGEFFRVRCQFLASRYAIRQRREAAPRGGFSSFKTMRLAQMLGRSPSRAASATWRTARLAFVVAR